MSESSIQLQGTLLLAEPTLRDGIFNHAVILLADHSLEEGAHGVILNHPSGHEVGEFLKDKQFAPLARIPVHVGGPVSKEQLTFSAFWWEAKSGLHWQLRLPAEKAIELTRRPGTVVRAFVGYAGWTAGQLENELRRQTWITTRPDPSLLGRSHDIRLWNEILASLSPYHRILAEAPPHPDQN